MTTPNSHSGASGETARTDASVVQCQKCGRLTRVNSRGWMLAHVTTTRAGFFNGCDGQSTSPSAPQVTP